MVANQPGDWSAEYTYEGVSYTGDHTTTLSGGGLESLELNVTTGSTAGVGEYIITVTSSDPDVNPMAVRYYTISGVTDLVVNNVEAFGDGSPYGTYDFEPYYTSGLDHAGNTTYGVAGDNVFVAGMKGDALNDVNNIYLNVGWTFPALTKDELRSFLEDFMDNGGNMFISGQDIGWEVDYYADNGLPASNTFYENYLHSVFINDEAAGATTFTAVPEEIYNGVLESDIEKSYGTTYYYPDQIETSDADGFPIFYYNNTESKIGGVRSETGTYKTVYLGIGLEMIEDDAVKDEVMKITHDYFYGTLTGIEFDQAMQNLLGNIAPNPASYSAELQLGNYNQPVTLVITDISGKLVSQMNVPANTPNISIDLSNMESGMYLYHITDGTQISDVRKLNVVK